MTAAEWFEHVLGESSVVVPPSSCSEIYQCKLGHHDRRLAAYRQSCHEQEQIRHTRRVVADCCCFRVCVVKFASSGGLFAQPCKMGRGSPRVRPVPSLPSSGHSQPFTDPLDDLLGSQVVFILPGLHQERSLVLQDPLGNPGAVLEAMPVIVAHQAAPPWGRVGGWARRLGRLGRIIGDLTHAMPVLPHCSLLYRPGLQNHQPVLHHGIWYWVAEAWSDTNLNSCDRH